MINIFRKYQQGLMIGVTIIVIISFVWFYNRTSMDKLANSQQDRIATIYGRGVSEVEVQRYVRKLQLCADLGLFDMLQNLSGANRERMYEDFVWNTIVLEHEAELNQVSPTDEEVLTEVKNLSPFQTSGQFDPQKYATFVQEKLAPRGFTEQQLEDVVRGDLKLRKLKSIIGSTVEAAPSELRGAYETQYQKTQLSLVRLNLAGISSGVQVPNEEVHKAFDQRKDSLKSDEKRKVKLVSLTLPTGDQSLKGKERMDALQKLADRANEFTQAMLVKDAQFDAVAAKFNLPVEQTGDFTQAKPDPKIVGTPAIVTEAFRLTPKDPNSDPVQTEGGFYILHLENLVPARALTFEEAKEELVESLKSERAREMLGVKSTEIHNRIEASLKAGKTFAEAATEAGQKVEAFPIFTLAELGDLLKKPDAPTIIQKSMEMSVGQLSDLIPVADGGVIVHVDSREAASEEQYKKDKASLQDNFIRAKRSLAFREWLRMRRDAAKIEVTKS